MSEKRPEQTQPDLNQAYRSFQTAHSTEANILELLMNTVNKLNEELGIANQNNIELRAKVVDLEKPQKETKIPAKPANVK